MIELFRIMPCRLTGLQSTIEGFKQTGIHLVTYDDKCTLGVSSVLGPAGLGDNVGSYYFIPKVVELTGMELERVVLFFYVGFVFIALLIAMFFIWLYCKTLVGKVVALVALTLLALVIAGIGDYYIYNGAIPMMFIPWWLYIKDKVEVGPIHLYFFFFILGLVFSVGHLIRSYSGTAVLIFVILSLVFFNSKYSKKVKVIAMFVMLSSMITIFSSFNNVLEKRISFLESIDSPFELSGDRVMWHNAYYSLGFLWNQYDFENSVGHEPSDAFSVKKALSINPYVKLFSDEYENILKYEFFDFIKKHPLFFIKSIFAKIGVILMYIVLFMNIGLILLFYSPLSYQLNIMFLSGIGFNSLFGIISTPEYQYLTGVFAFSVIYSICIMDNAVANGVLNNIKIKKIFTR